MPTRRAIHRRGALLAGAIAIWFGATPAPALEVRDPRIVVEGPALAVTLAVIDPFGARAHESLMRGMPASLEITADLWRHRPFWFDEHLASRTVMVRVRYDAWREEYNLQTDLDPLVQRATLVEIEGEIGMPRRLTLLPRAGLRSGEHYYVVCSALSRPLTPEALRQVEEFLASQADPESAGWVPMLPGLGNLPHSFVALLGALSGLGEESARAVTPRYVAP